jgi:hypothetical protein
MPGKYQVAAYYFPNYHFEPMNNETHGKCWTEWELLRRAEPRFAGHRQPRVPLWGYEDDSDPRAFAHKIDVAADYGVDSFIFDWYWYDNRLYLGRALEQGFLRSINLDRMKFAIHWCNHDWLNIHPAKLGVAPEVRYTGGVDRPTFDRIAKYLVDRYFTHPAYWRIDGKPYFSIYELRTLVKGLGGPRQTRDALKSLRAKAKAAGLQDLHINAVYWGVKPPRGSRTKTSPAQVLKALGIDSVTSYVWVHDIDLPTFPETDYDRVAKQASAHWRVAAAACGMSYFPNVTMGWDPSPRTVQSDRYVNVGYPFMPTLCENTPARFKEALQRARAFVDKRADQPKVVIVNAWNEWTEGSYLEPDTVTGMAYLQAIKDAFKAGGGKTTSRKLKPATKSAL